MPLVGLISDTHGKLDERVLEAFKRCDYILHAGDICAQSVLWELESITTTIAVLGNNDFQDYGSSVQPSVETTIGGVRLYMAHYPEDAQLAAMTGKFDLAIHGHTHVPRDEIIKGCRVVNPGSAARPRYGSKKCVALVELKDGVVGPVTTVSLDDIAS